MAHQLLTDTDRGPDLRGQTVLVLHAHPDDEAIFTGITLRRLADAGRPHRARRRHGRRAGRVPRAAAARRDRSRERRITELERAAELLGVSRLVLLGHRDSGLPGWPSGAHARALAAADPLPLARRVAEIADDEGAGTLVHDDEQGIYGHPDHRATFRIGATAAELVGATGYRMTVDREHLHVSARDGHLVHGAARAAAVDVRAGRPRRSRLAVAGAAEPTSSQAGRDHRPREPGRPPTTSRSRRLRRRLRLRVVPPHRRPGRARRASATPTSSPSDRPLRPTSRHAAPGPVVGEPRRPSPVAAPTGRRPCRRPRQ